MSDSGQRLLRSYLSNRGQTQSDLAEELGCSRPLVTQWLGGHQRPSARMATILEAVSDGAVPAVSWVSAEESWPEGQRSPLSSGGDAHPKGSAAELLGSWLHEHSWTQSAFAEATGYTRSAVSQWVRGETSPRLRAAVVIENVTGGAVPATTWHGVAQGSGEYQKATDE